MPESTDTTTEVSGSTPAGWYADPWAQHERRYWNGAEWTGRTEDGEGTAPRRARRPRGVAIVLAVAGVAAVVLAAVSFGEDREKLALLAVVLVLPLAVFNIVGLARARDRNRARRPVAVVVGTWVLVVAVVAVGGYRGFQQTSCTSELKPGAKLAGCGLAGRDLTKFDLHGADLSGADLSDADLAHVDLSGANLTGATLRNADLASADLDDAVLHEAILDGATLIKTSLHKANLSGAKLHKVVATNATLSDANLKATEIIDSDLTGAVLDTANLEGAVLQNTNLASASLTFATFTNATLTKVALDDAVLENVVDLSDKALAGAFEVDVRDVAKALNDRRLSLEPAGETSNAAAGVCTGKPIKDAATSPTNGAFVVIVNDGPTSFDWPTDPPARRFLELVACVGSITSTDVDECGPYFFPDGSLAHPITRYRESVTVRVLHPSTLAVVAERTFDGPEPEPCPISSPVSVYRQGTPVDEGAIDAGIAEMVSAGGA